MKEKTIISDRNKGVFFIILSAFCFALMNVFVRMAGDLPFIQKSFFRNFVAFFFALILMKKQGIKISMPKGSKLDLVLRATFGTIGIFCNFYAIDNMLVSDASMLNKLSPFFVIIFSYFILSEKIKPFQGLCVFIAFIGTLFVIKPGFTGIPIFPALIGIVGGMCAGIAYTYVRKLGTKGVKGPFIVFFFSMFSCLVSLPYLILEFKPMSPYQILILLLTGLAASGGQFFITAAYTHAPAREISIYDYSQIIFATILSFVLLGQIPDLYSFIGYIIICIASVIMFLYNNNKILSNK
ncbi:DMT family transporter [Anaerofustis stercorihominis]|uniref:DMT family transporter n=1 Tax=Anaerofustis stercorihominis TaxID=214853 RepID=A0A3E3E171_9FIRM|nr:DMT family transporter [Anaerofustis stercorihominis]MCQ4796059.1 DMT family transporter [Anaerofustis stercorihominis]RGD75035.1 DMT family transporter [Anaerofustis stercorihominis]